MGKQTLAYVDAEYRMARWAEALLQNDYIPDALRIVLAGSMGQELRQVQRLARDFPSRPPSTAEFLFFLFYNHQHAEALCGDLEERFPRMVRKFGYRKAWFWFWWQVLGSVGRVASVWITPKILWVVSALQVLRIPLGVALAWMAAHHWIGSDSWGALLAEVLKRVRE